MTTPLIEAIARKLCINDDRNPDDPFFVNSPDGLRQWKGFEFDARTALTAITEAGYQLTRVIDEDEAQRIMARSVVEYQASTAISAAQGDG